MSYSVFDGTLNLAQLSCGTGTKWLCTAEADPADGTGCHWCITSKVTVSSITVEISPLKFSLFSFVFFVQKSWRWPPHLLPNVAVHQRKTKTCRGAWNRRVHMGDRPGTWLLLWSLVVLLEVTVCTFRVSAVIWRRVSVARPVVCYLWCYLCEIT